MRGRPRQRPASPISSFPPRGAVPGGRNAIATVLVATWTRELDRDQLDAVLAGHRPIDEATMLDDDGHGGGSSDDTLTDLDHTTQPETARR